MGHEWEPEADRWYCQGVFECWWSEDEPPRFCPFCGSKDPVGRFGPVGGGDGVEPVKCSDCGCLAYGPEGSRLCHDCLEHQQDFAKLPQRDKKSVPQATGEGDDRRSPCSGCLKSIDGVLLPCNVCEDPDCSRCPCCCSEYRVLANPGSNEQGRGCDE